MEAAGLSASEVERLVATRRDLHAHPELGWEERRTAEVVSARLGAAGYAPRAVRGTGVVADLEGARPGRTVLLRADMDALPIAEETSHGFASRAPGVMHACGHDGHTAALLCAAERLAAGRASLRGRVRLCFQPAEEGRGGAKALLEEGVLEGVERAFALHLWNELPTGSVACADGPVWAACDVFEAAIHGRGGHGGMPDLARDPVVAAAHVVTALQTLVSREASPLDAVVVTVGKLSAGDTWNVIPDLARLHGTCRSFDPATHRALPERLARVVRGVSEALGCRAELEYRVICPPTVNDPAMAALARAAATRALGPGGRVLREGPGTRAMVGEDFAFFLERVPGALLLVGSRDESRGLVQPHHSPRFDFDEGALPIAARLLEEVALAALEGA